MSCLEEIYAAQQGRSRQTVISLSAALQDELCMAVALLPLTVIDMRLQPSARLVASDASSTAEAAVSAEVGPQFTAEAQRHALQKGLWNRLVSPYQAYCKEKGFECDAGELPDGKYEMHPLWQEVVQAEVFAPFGQVRKSKKRRHINIGEVRAALEAERELGEREPDSYYLHLQDSQVSLAALVKGRSSSRHLNKEIRASIPDHVVSNVRPFYGFVRSKLNPADDPTRDAPLRRPSKEQALWMQELKKGNCDAFDAELSKWGLDLQQLRGLPEESELWRKMPDNLLNGRQKKFSTWAQNKKKKQPMQPAGPVTQVEHSLPVGGLGRSRDRPLRPGEDEETSTAMVGGALPGAHPISGPGASGEAEFQRVSTCRHQPPLTVTQVEPGLPVGEVGRSDDRPRCPGEDEETSAAVAGGALPGAHPISVGQAVVTLETDAASPTEGQKMSKRYTQQSGRTVTQVEPGLPVGVVGRSDDRPHCPGEDEETSTAIVGGDLPGAHPISVRQSTAALDCANKEDVQRTGVCSEARALLLQLPRSQFLWSKSFDSLEDALDRCRAVLDLFSGSRGVAKACVEVAEVWVLTFDIQHDDSEDLLDPKVQQLLSRLLTLRSFLAMGAAPVCASFSVAITPPCRSLEYPQGLPTCSEKQKLKNEQGNLILKFLLEMVLLCLQLGIYFFVENSDGSWMWRQTRELSWKQILSFKTVGDFRLDYCRYGTAWRKRTRFRTNTQLQQQKLFCQRLKPHVKLRGRCRARGVSFTKLAEPYPRKLCLTLALALMADAGKLGARRRLDVAACAKAGCCRIGEAINPGPRRSRLRPEVDLALMADAGKLGARRRLDVAACAKAGCCRIGEAINPGPRRSRLRPEVDLALALMADAGKLGARRRLNVAACAKAGCCCIGEAINPGPRRSRLRPEVDLAGIELLEPATIAIRERVTESFLSWFSSEYPDADFATWAGAVPSLAVLALVAFGHYSYDMGTPLLYYRQLLAHMQRSFLQLRPFMMTAWETVSKWELMEPTQHRPPLPEPLLHAMTVLGISWGWPRWSAVLLGCFYAICRVGEFLTAQRKDVLTPQDLLSDEAVIYLQIKLPKTRRRGAAVQYATISEPAVVQFLCSIWDRLKRDEFLYPGSAGAFRSRWDAALKHIGIGKQHRLTPGSLRGGGAVACHRRGIHISDLLWKMRLQHQRTLSYYLQETTAMSVLPALEESVRTKVQFLRDALPLFLHQRGPAAHTSCKEVADRLRTRCQPR